MTRLSKVRLRPVTGFPYWCLRLGVPLFANSQADAQDVNRTAPVSVQDPATGEWGVCVDPGDGSGARFEKGGWDLAVGKKGRNDEASRVAKGKHIAQADIHVGRSSSGGLAQGKRQHGPIEVAPVGSSQINTGSADTNQPANGRAPNQNAARSNSGSPSVMVSGSSDASPSGSSGGAPHVRSNVAASGAQTNPCDRASGLLLPAVQKVRDSSN